MQPTLALVASVLPALAAASPLTVRAGGPAAVPIPANCTTLNPLPHAHCGTGNVHGFKPIDTFTTAHSVYAAYYDASQSLKATTEQCFQQCYGYGTPGTCKAALLAQNVPTPKGYYGTSGGALETACLLFGDYLDPLQFTAAPSGQYVNATAINIYCPSS